MVCNKCESKLSKLVVPDKWKEGARNVIGGKDGGIKHSNHSIHKIRSTTTFNPMERKCKICKSSITHTSHYCQDCAYKKGICTMCGRKILNTKSYRMSTI